MPPAKDTPEAKPLRKLDPHRGALLTCLAYAGMGALWILLSNRLWLPDSPDSAEIARMQTFKGGAFIGVTAGLLYVVLLRQFRRWEQESTKRKKAEEGLQLMRDMMECTRDAIFVMDLESGKPLEVNETACRERGYTREELCNLTLSEISTVLSPTYTWEMHVAKIKASGGGFFESHHKRKDGTTFPVEASVSHGQAGDQPYTIAIVRDITARLQTQAELQRSTALLKAVADGTTDSVFVKDREGRYLFFNEAAARFAQCPAAQILGRDDTALFDAESARVVMEADRRVILSGRPVVDEKKLTTAKGITRTFLSSKVPYRDEAGNIIGLIGISRDITDRVKIEDALRDIAERKAADLAIRKTNADLERRIQERTRDLEEANSELEAFSYSVSHDLRAPLRQIQGYVQLLQRTCEGQLSEKVLHYLRTIGEAGEEMGQLIDDLLAFSRMARTEMSETVVSLDELAREVVRSLDPTAKERNIDWQIGPLPEVMGDAAMLKLVLVNLLGNAVKYTRPREPARIELGAAPAEEGLVSIFVRDNGVGFDMEYAHKLFGVFQRLHRAEEFEGTGIGLATVRRIVARHGGSVTAEGKLDQGAVFHFTLKPAAAAPTSPPPPT